MFRYLHKVRYYETDRMGITHHSNYIRFMEEARVEWMSKLGIGYKKCEELGFVSPLLEINCEYKHNTTFEDEIIIEVELEKYNGLKMEFSYKMYLEDKLVAKGISKHCFVNKDGFPVRLKRDYPELDEKLLSQIME